MTINSDMPMPMPMQGIGGQEGGGDAELKAKMEAKAKSMGVPDEVIAKGKSAVIAWVKENGKVPGGGENGMQDGSGNGMGNGGGMGGKPDISEQLKAGSSYDGFA